MKVKLHNFFNNPWVAFPLMILTLIGFFAVMFYFDAHIHKLPHSEF